MSDPNSNPNPDAGNSSSTTPTVPTVDVQGEIAKAIAERESTFAAELERMTGFKSLAELEQARLKEDGKLQELLDGKTQEVNNLRGQFHTTLINNSLLAASSDAIDPEVVQGLLASKAVVNAAGDVVVDGKPVQQAVAELLKAKPHLAKPTGSPGSGAPNSQTPAKPDLSGLSAVERLNLARQQGAN